LEYGCGSFGKRGSWVSYACTSTREHGSEVALNQPPYVRERADLRVSDGLRKSADLFHGRGLFLGFR
jgi:hypothetical protein